MLYLARKDQSKTAFCTFNAVLISGTSVLYNLHYTIVLNGTNSHIYDKFTVLESV